MKAYLDLVKHILETGERRPNRTGVDTIAVPGAMITHDMSDGFPLLTTKKVPYRWVAAELEFFIKGITDKRWLQERGVTIWDEWARQDKVPYGHSKEQKEKMLAENDLGPIYGWQWRNFGALYPDPKEDCDIGAACACTHCEPRYVDQLKNLVNKLKTDPSDRRMIVSAWNPMDIPKMGLPPCHYGFQVLVMNNKLHLLWNIRSVDVALGMPFNIASYATLLHLLAREGEFEEGRLVGFCGDAHIYENHIKGLEEQLTRKPYPLPTVKTKYLTSIFEWQHTDTLVFEYKHHPKIPFEIAV